MSFLYTVGLCPSFKLRTNWPLNEQKNGWWEPWTAWLLADMFHLIVIRVWCDVWGERDCPSLDDRTGQQEPGSSGQPLYWATQRVFLEQIFSLQMQELCWSNTSPAWTVADCCAASSSSSLHSPDQQTTSFCLLISVIAINICWYFQISGSSTETQTSDSHLTNLTPHYQLEPWQHMMSSRANRTLFAIFLP